jgi:hypothetical protein
VPFCGIFYFPWAGVANGRLHISSHYPTQAKVRLEWGTQHLLPVGQKLRYLGASGLVLTFVAMVLFSAAVLAQAPGSSTTQTASTTVAEPPGTSTDLFVMMGSDFDRPGLLPRANYNIGIGHTFEFLKKDPFGDEITFGYTYENSGTHGFFYTGDGEHTESAGVMKNFSLPKTTVVSGYTWIQSGITSYTGRGPVQNRMASGVSLGAIVHFSRSSSIWIQESYSKVVTVPWYTTTSVGYTYSW